MRGLRVMVFGYGKIGSRVAQNLARENEVWVYCRSEKPAHRDIKFIKGDVSDTSNIEAKTPDNLDVVLYCLSPSVRNEDFYRAVYVQGLTNVLLALQRRDSQAHCFFVSSTSVYHQDDSSVVNEQSVTNPAGFAGRSILEAETALHESAVCGTSVRFSGIYGGERSRLIDQLRDGVAMKSSAVRLSNRIHEDDCVGFLLHLIALVAQQKTVEDCYVATDDCPVDLNDVLMFIAKEYGFKEPLEGASPTRRAGNKRCSNQRMKDAGYVLQYPSYREGYARSLS